jgi:broad specificity phosphatase PhoE
MFEGGAVSVDRGIEHLPHRGTWNDVEVRSSGLPSRREEPQYRHVRHGTGGTRHDCARTALAGGVVAVTATAQRYRGRVSADHDRTDAWSSLNRRPRPVDEQPLQHRPRHDRTTATHVLALRHGQSEWNALGRWQGQADTQLTPMGEQQAQIAAEALAAEAHAFDAIWASDLVRARRTAEIAAGVLGIGDVNLDTRLRETHAGEWQGLTRDEIESGWPGYLAADRRPPTFEDYDSAGSRMLDALTEIGAAHMGGHVLVISHTGVIRAARRLHGAPDFLLPNLGGGWFTVCEHDEPAVTVGGIVLPLDPLGGGVIE